MSTIYIIRHAHKEKGDFYNPRLRHQDEPLSQQGQEQAGKLWSYFCDKEISGIYVSAYRRTRETIAYVSRQLGIAPIADERLNEIDNGCIEGMSDGEIQQRYPEVWRGFRERSMDFRFPEGRPVRRRATGLRIFSRRNGSGMPMKI
jgi:broad specificity phosphatase PhoE